MTRFASVFIVIGLLAGSIFFSACSTDEGKAQYGDIVKVHYTGTLDDGWVFDSSIDPTFGHGEPLLFIIGEGTLMPGFEQAVIGLSINESTTVRIPADEAYGPLVVVGNLNDFPPDEPPQVGEQYEIGLENDLIIRAEVTAISGLSVTLQNTHQLAGEDLNFDITLVEILSTMPMPTAAPTPTFTIYMSCEEARDAIQEAINSYHEEYGKWPTIDGQPGDIEWSELNPSFMPRIPSNDSDCDWWVNSDPEGEVCLQNEC